MLKCSKDCKLPARLQSPSGRPRRPAGRARATLAGGAGDAEQRRVACGESAAAVTITPPASCGEPRRGSDHEEGRPL